MAHSAFEKMCQAFADAGAAVLKAVSDAFLAASSIDLGRSGVGKVLAVTTGFGMALAVLLLLGQVLRTGLTMRGEHLAQGVVGVFKAAFATGTVVAVATALLAASDALSTSIMDATFGSAHAFTYRFAHAAALGSSGNPAAPMALLLVFGLVAIVVGAVLFGEMLFRHAAVVVMIAVSPIAAAGMVAGTSASWWRKLATAGIQLIFLKPLIVLVFAVGFGMTGNSTDVLGILAGLVTLVIAAFAWPMLARFCTWTSAHVAEAGGLTAFVGGFLGAEARGAASRAIPRARTSSIDSARLMMARHHAHIDAALIGAGAGAAGLGLAAGAARAGGQYTRNGWNGMAEHGGLAEQQTPPSQRPDSPSARRGPLPPPAPPPPPDGPYDTDSNGEHA